MAQRIYAEVRHDTVQSLRQELPFNTMEEK